MKRKKSKKRALRRAVLGGLSRLRKRPGPAAHSIEPGHSRPNGLTSGDGILRPPTGALRLPHALAEAGETETDDSNGWMPGPVVLTVTACAIVFIVIIAWFVSQLPEK